MTSNTLCLQARMPECKPNVTPTEMPERSSLLEEFQWHPKGVTDGDLMMFLRAARYGHLYTNLIWERWIKAYLAL